MNISLTEPQSRFVISDAKYPAFVGGLGSGKTHAGMWRSIRLKKENPTIDVGYYLPTYGLIHDIIIPRFQELFETYKVPYRLNQQHNYFEIENSAKIIMRSMDRPEKIIGYETSDAILDELDTLPYDKAQDVWSKVVARTRKKKTNGKINTRAVVTTPEGFKFVYDKWKKNPMAGSVLFKAPTYSNPYLPDDYVDSLRETMPENALMAYLEGEFVNMTNATVYSEFDRHKCHTPETIQPTDTLHVGMDFNVGKMACAIGVLRSESLHFVKEHDSILDTPAMIVTLKNTYPNHKIIVYPDASGRSRKSVNASESDISLLQQAGFSVFVNNRNPAVKDRVLSMNSALKNNIVMVNSDACPILVECLEKQAYDKNGEPDKTSGFDHMNDSASYLCVYRYPVKKSTNTMFKLKGL